MQNTNLYSSQEIYKEIRVRREQLATEVKKFEELIKLLPKELRNVSLDIELEVEQKKSWKGIVPPPGTLKEYNDAVPDGAERILQIAEKQSEHRLEMEKQVTDEDQRQNRNGQNFAFIIALTFL